MIRNYVKPLAQALLFTGISAAAGYANALETQVMFSTDGTGDGTTASYDTVDITTFDWAADSSVIIEQALVSATGTAAACTTLNCFFAVADPGDTLTFNLHVNTFLNDFISPALPGPDIPDDQVTAVLSMVETARLGLDGETIEFISVADSTVSWYYNEGGGYSLNRDTGAGFTDGDLILSGHVVSTGGQFGPNDDGVLSGNSPLGVVIDSYDFNFLEAYNPECGILPAAGTCLVGATFSTNLDLLFPSSLPFIDVPGGVIGAIDGDGRYTTVAGDFLLSADADSNFARVPAPSGLLLLGIGLLALSGIRQKRAC